MNDAEKKIITEVIQKLFSVNNKSFIIMFDQSPGPETTKALSTLISKEIYTCIQKLQDLIPLKEFIHLPVLGG